MGFEVLDKRELAQLVSAVEAAGIKVTVGDARRVRRATRHRLRRVRRSGRESGRALLRPDPRPRPGADAARQFVRHRRHGDGPRDRVGRGCRGDARLLHRRARVRRAQHDGPHVVPRLQPAPPHVRHRPPPRAGRVAAPDGRGGHARRRRPGPRPCRQARHPDDEHARQAHQRPDGVVLRVLAGELRHRVRMERPARHRGAPDLRDHAGRVLGPQVHPAAEPSSKRAPA